MAFRAAIISLVLACAIHTHGSKLDFDDDDRCPNGWTGSGVDGHMICCFGMPVTESTDDGLAGYCCVYDPTHASRNMDENDCSTKIDVTEPEYTSLVSAASKSIMTAASASQDEKTSLSVTQTPEPTASDSAEGTRTDNVGSIVTSNLLAKFGITIMIVMLIMY